MKQLKIIVAFVAGLFAFTSVQAGELSVTGSMQATYQNEIDDVTGNPLGMKYRSYVFWFNRYRFRYCNMDDGN